jgi:hypothetical protein
MIRAHISGTARTFNPARARVARKRTPKQVRDDETLEGRKRQFNAIAIRTGNARQSGMRHESRQSGQK